MKESLDNMMHRKIETETSEKWEKAKIGIGKQDDTKVSKEQIKGELISELGSLLHEEWRSPRKKEDGSFDPRIKKTKDENWVKSHNTEEVDIANTEYKDLPEDWKGENKASAEVTVDEIYKAIDSEKELDSSFIEEASDVLHQEWMKRKTKEGYNENDENWNWAKPLMVDYNKLPNEEKGKDRVIIRKGIEIYNKKI